jgi:hypothetical protein
MPVEDSKPPSNAALVPISYRRVQIGISEWAVVDSFECIGEWHAAKAVLDRNRVLVRMLSNPFDENLTDLIVPSTDALWAADLLRQRNAPKIEQALGFPMVKAPSLPTTGGVGSTVADSDLAGAMQVLELDPSIDFAKRMSNYGCVLAALWGLLVVVVILLVIFLATYQYNGY